MNPRLEKLLNLALYKRVLILVVLCLAVAGGFVYFLYLPGQEEIRQLQERDRQLQTKLLQDRRIADDLPKFKAEYERMKEQLDQALTELPNKREIPSLLTSIATLAKENGLEVLRFQPKPESPQGFYAKVPVDLRLVGSYHEIAMFSDAVGRLPRIVNISNLSLGSPKVEGRRALLSVTCLATTFRFIEETQAKGKKK